RGRDADVAARRARGGARRPRDAPAALRQQLGGALAELRGKALRDASVHEARKQLKRARATLRLLRGGIRAASYRRANRRLRDAGRPLSDVRDARVLLDVVASLVVEVEPSQRGELAALLQELRGERRQLRRALRNAPHGLRSVRQALESVRRDSRRWPA